MAKYKKKPLVIDAVKFDSKDISTQEHINFSVPNHGQSIDPMFNKYWVQTLEGPLIVSQGDYIITGIKGEHYPCKPDIFEASYDLVID